MFKIKKETMIYKLELAYISLRYKINKDPQDIINNKNQLCKLQDFNEIFEFVKKCVSSIFEMNRTGLNLILQGMPNALGAYHVLGSNFIVANRYLLEYIKSTSSKEEYNSYVFAVLAHEYFHSLGIVNENQVRKMTYKLCLDLFGKDHTTTKFANNPLSAFPNIPAMHNKNFEKGFIQVEKFDYKNLSYIN